MNLRAPSPRESSFRSGQHIPALDGIRGLAVATIFIHHYGGGRQSPNVLIHSVGEAIHLGWIGVSIFFVLSGFLISGILWDSFAKPGWWRAFYLRRSLRIFPLYYLALLLAFAIPAVVGASAFSLRPIWIYLLYLQNVPLLATQLARFPSMLPMGHFWSLAVEEQFYLLWPLLLFTRRRSRSSAMSVCIALFVVSFIYRAVMVTAGTNFAWSGGFLLGRMGELLTGGYLALAMRGTNQEVERLLRYAPWYFFAGAAGVLLVVWRSGSVEGGEPLMLILGLPLIGLTAAALIACCLRGGRVAAIFEMEWLRWLGKISYGIYVYHVLLVYGFIYLTNRLLPATAGNNLRLIVLAAIAAVGTLLVASLSFYAFEQPLLRLKERFSQRAGNRTPLQKIAS